MGAGYHGGFGVTKGSMQFATGDLTFMSKPEFFFELAAKRNLIDPDGKLDIVAHGAMNTIQLVINGKTINVTARFLARMLKHSKKYGNKQEIRLVSCNTGRDDYGFAQQLANKLNVTVLAPTKKYIAYSDGNYVVADTKWIGGKEYVDYNSIGYMKKFKPGGAYKK